MRALVPSALLLAALASACGSSVPETQSNLLIVLLDTTRADHLGCYGGATGTSPAMDALAGRGTRFEEALAQSSLTPVSTSSILTGTYPFRHGVRSLFTVGKESLSDSVLSLPEVLQEQGLATAAFVSAMPLNGKKYGLSRGFGSYSDEPGQASETSRERGLPNANQRRANDTTNLVLDWIDEHADQRFGLLVHYFDAHDDTLVPPVKFVSKRMTIPARGAPMSEAQRRELYDVEIAYMDRQVERMLEQLEEHGVLDDTLVVIVADHGEGLGQHDFWTHGLLWHEQLRVPLILAGPGVPEGRVISDRVRLVDLFPTLLELLGIEEPAGREERHGRSMAGLLAGTPDASPRELYAEVHHAEDDFLGRDAALVTLTMGRWKYVQGSSGESQLFDVEADPGELHDLFTEDHPELPRLRARLAELGALDGYRASTEGQTPEELEALRALGYVGDDEPDEGN